MVFFYYSIPAFFILLFSLPTYAEDYSEVESYITDRAKRVVETTTAAGPESDGARVVPRFAEGGSERVGGRIKDHPWRDGNPDWQQVWQKEDFEVIEKGFNEYYQDCYNFKIIGCCCITCPCPWAYVGYWWPEVVVTINNHCTGALLGPDGTNFSGKCTADNGWRERLDEVVGPEVRKKIEQGLPSANVTNVPGMDANDFPEGLRSGINTGQSHSTNVGVAVATVETTHLEAHLLRTFLDEQGAKGEWDPPDELRPCFTPLCVRPWQGRWDSVYPKWWTENIDDEMALNWRMPERSIERASDSRSCNRLYKAHWKEAAEMSMFSETDLPGNFEKLQNNTCGSYRASAEAEDTIRRRYPVDEIHAEPLNIKSNDDLRLKKNCFSRDVGQIYPLVGNDVTIEEDGANIALALRTNEWSSWCKWDDDIRSNIFNYRGGTRGNFSPMSDMFESTVGKGDSDASSINRTSGAFWGPRATTYLEWPTPPDKLQRIYPVKGESDRCFTIDEADRRLDLTADDFLAGLVNDPNSELNSRFGQDNRQFAGSDDPLYPNHIFPEGLYNSEQYGETRIVIWNFRTCCVNLGGGTYMGAGCIPVTE